MSYYLDAYDQRVGDWQRNPITDWEALHHLSEKDVYVFHEDDVMCVLREYWGATA